MRLFGLTITRKQFQAGFQSIERHRGWFPLVREGFTGAWQRNVVLSTEDVLMFSAVYACVTLKACDIAKLRIKLLQQTSENVWEETTNPAYTPFLRKPNHFQTRQQFIEQWMLSKFIHGNTYAIKQRNARGGDGNGNVTAMYVLDPRRVRVQVAPDGAVYYAISQDPLSKLEEAVVVPASEIVHDMMPPLYHPLFGVSPLAACGLAASQGLRAQNQSAQFFEQGSVPSGVIEVTDDIDDDQARAIQKRWQEEFSGNNAGKVAVLGVNMKYKPMTMSAVDSQLVEQLNWNALNVCTAHHVPPYMVGVGPMPTYNNIEALNTQYYSQGLQSPIEHLESLLNQGLELPERLGTECDLDGLLRMDTVNKMDAAEKAIKAGMSPNEVRRKFHGLGAVQGGETPYLQQQNFSLEALAKRDAQDDPFATGSPAPKPVSAGPTADDKSIMVREYRKALAVAA